MVDSLRRSRYPRNNNTNNPYTMYFDVDQVNINSKSRTKKRDSPKKRFLNKTLEDEEKHLKSKDETAAKRDEHVELVKSESYDESEEVEESGKRKFSPTSTTASPYEQQERRQDNEQHSEQKRPDSRPATGAESEQENPTKKLKGNDEKDQMFELFQPWALKTYGDQAKTKTITLKKKSRILKALNGKEHNNPDSSKFRFWVKSKGFTTQRPDSYRISSSGSNASQDTDGTREDLIDLYVASMTKDFGERTFKKVAVVEEFFNIIYNVHVDFGGRNGRHAGQKRTYRIITETYAFLPREAVTKFLSGCPACKKNLRPFSPSKFDDNFTESSSEFDVLNYSSQNDSSIDSIGSAKVLLNTQKDIRYSVVSSPANFKQDDKDDKNVSFREKLHTPCAVVEPFHKSEPISYFEDISAKFCNYYKNYGGYPNLGDIRHDNILSYYQYLKKYSPTPSPLSRQSSPVSLCSSSVAKNPINDSISSRKSPLEDLSRFKPISNVQKPQLSIFTPPTSPLVKDCSNEPRIDLQIVQTKNSPDYKFPQSININIEESTDSSSARGTCSASKPPQSESNLFIKSVDVSINVTSHNINQLKISCKTTPPKKRYSIYKPATLPDSDNHHQCAINLSKKMDRHSTTKCDLTKEAIRTESPPGYKDTEDNSIRVDLDKVKPITSTYLKWTRSMGLSDADALQIDDLETLPTPASDTVPDQNSEEAYAGLMKDADKLKLMLLAWNYQNSNAVRNGAEAPDLGVVGGLWAQYQNALALNTKQPSVSPVHRPEQSSPIENQDETNSSGQKDEDDGSEDDSDDKLDQNAQDPERLKAFNMFVRLFVDENLDRMIPISKQPKEKIQAIIDSCARQFPEFCERSRKRIRTYLKSCRRNKKAREGWDNASRPTPAHLTSVQAEQILAIACENESMNAKRMRVGLDPISQAMPLPSGSTNSIETIAPSTQYPGFRTTPNTTVSTSEPEGTTPSTTAQSANPSRNSPLSLSVTGNEAKPLTVVAASTTTNSQVSSPLYRPADFTSPSSTSSPYSSRPQTYPPFFSTTGTVNATPTDLSMKQHQSQQPPQSLSSSGISPNNRPPIVTHKLSANEITAARQVITAYRESAAFLLRTADQVEQLLLQQQ